MKPESVRRVAELDQQHRRLQQELKQWTGMAEPLDVLQIATHGTRPSLIVPSVVDWNAMRAATMQRIRAAIAANREALELL